MMRWVAVITGILSEGYGRVAQTIQMPGNAARNYGYCAMSYPRLIYF
jgi:hypothetical protein